MKTYIPNIVVVDDDVPFSKMIEGYLKSQHYRNIKVFHSGEECFKNFDGSADVFIQDYELPDTTGLEIMKKIKSMKPDCEFIFLSGQGSIQVAVNTLKEGAFDYVVKDNYAQENIINKLHKVHYIKKIKREAKLFKQGLYIISTVFLILISIIVTMFLIGANVI